MALRMTIKAIFTDLKNLKKLIHKKNPLFRKDFLYVRKIGNVNK
jgi:hypothetical protein